MAAKALSPSTLHAAETFRMACIVDTLRRTRESVFGPESPSTLCHWLDVGGRDGTIGEALVRTHGSLACDVYNVSVAAPRVIARARRAGIEGRLGFVSGDFLSGPLPLGYDVVSYLGVLHEWTEDIAFLLLRKARQALAVGSRIVICEEFRTEVREREWYVKMLEALGFAETRVLHGAFDLVTGVA